MSLSILKVDSSGRYEGSHSRSLTGSVVDALKRGNPGATLVERDVAHGIDVVDQLWIANAYTPADERSAEGAARLNISDDLVAELQAADVLVLGVPIYNFGIPAAFKAWVDQICRAGVTFKYGENGPVGLLEGKKAYVVVTSGGTEVDGAVDFATPHVRQILNFIGITDIEIIAADRLMMDESRMKAAYGQVDQMFASAA